MSNKGTINFTIEEVVRKRYSVRNYNNQNVEEEKRLAIQNFIESIDNPFGEKVRFHFLDKGDINDDKTLGTYGVIKGAKQYIGATIELGPMSLEALGYEFEMVILYLAHIGLGTCWLGGTFNRKGFAKALNIGENQVFPIISPYGYAASTKHMKEIAMRKLIKADYRKDWTQLFYKNDFKRPLARKDAGDLEFPLEMIRLGPSASNKQPWRVLIIDDKCHFYEYKEPGYSDIFPYDIQRIDMGIAAAHFDLAVKEKGILGHFDNKIEPEIYLPKNFIYSFSWIRE
ncbi:nitroreductase [Tissierella creatinini]|nr:nitroreductase [Tissierella creatinini]TJX59367.1 nitroreductase [Soehngenia saccharolytica]